VIDRATSITDRGTSVVVRGLSIKESATFALKGAARAGEYRTALEQLTSCTS
jgi:hypothetical protein